MAEATLKSDLQIELVKKDKEIAELHAKNERKLAEQLSEKEREIASMKSILERVEIEQKLTITEAIQQIEKERNELASTLKLKETEKQLLENP